MERTYSGLQKALNAIDARLDVGSDDTRDGVQKLADVANVKRKTVLNWLREDGTPHGTVVRPDNKVWEAAEKAGGAPALAKRLGVSPQAVREWIKYGYVPPRRAQEIELAYGIPRGDLLSPKMRSAMGLGGDL